MCDEPSTELLARWRAGDEQAAAALFARYAEKLLARVRSQLSARLAARLDPEDITQSAWRSFFAGARADRYVFERSGDLWHLLAVIALHKLQRHVQYHTAAKRAVAREQPGASDSQLFGLPAAVIARDPEPAEAAAVVDELEHVLNDLKPLHQQMIQMRLQGYSLAEIALATQRSLRLIKRVLQDLRGRLQQRYEALAASDVLSAKHLPSEGTA